MPEGNVVKLQSYIIIRCIYHAKQSRYQIRAYEEEGFVEVLCLECNPPHPICRFELEKEHRV